MADLRLCWCPACEPTLSVSVCVCVSVLILKPAELKLPASTSLPTATEKGPKACHELEFSKGVRVWGWRNSGMAGWLAGGEQGGVGG